MYRVPCAAKDAKDAWKTVINYVYVAEYGRLHPDDKVIPPI